ncbi:DUF3298 and DUF4163 domain-containing protein [Rapidithrix thailandica]|uniref:DUF3298 and DUF4163 domain-containing protein n=1 Tax=Rapidithrix thailandica TaxID=413964 RepID=A0AAW9RWY4_9BACT
MRNQTHYWIAAFLTLLFSCNSQKNEHANSAVKYTLQQWEEKEGDCQQPDQPCAQVTVEYPEFKGGPNKAGEVLNQVVNTALEENLKSSSPENQQTPGNLKAQAAAFLKEYAAFHHEFPDSPQQWYIHLDIDVIYESPQLITLNVFSDAFTGGAHPNSFVKYINIDLTQLKTLSIEDIVSDMARFSEIAELKFRKARFLKPEADLKTAGFFWDENKFKMAKNFACTKEGIYLYYNSYEIAPYALGPTKVFIPYSELEGVIKKQY